MGLEERSQRGSKLEGQGWGHEKLKARERRGEHSLSEPGLSPLAFSLLL